MESSQKIILNRNRENYDSPQKVSDRRTDGYWKFKSNSLLNTNDNIHKNEVQEIR